MYVVPALTPAVALAFALGTGSGLLVGVLFVVVMGALGLVVGRFVGNDERLIQGIGSGRPSINEETRRHAKEALEALEAGETSEVLFPLLRQMNNPAIVGDLFAGAPLDNLLSLVPELANLPKERRPYGDQLLRLLARIGSFSDDATRMRILGAMIRVMGRFRHAAPFLVEMCKRVPDAWNDLQPSMEDAASRDPAIAKYLREAAGPKEPFVRQATETYMMSMVRFRRLCEDRASGMAGQVDAELKERLAREFGFLKIAGTVSRRFVWLPAQAHRFHPLITDDQLDLLLREAPSDLAEVHALLGQLALTWALEGKQEHRVRKLLAALEDVAKSHPTAADALLDVFLGLKPEDAASARADREDVRRRAYFALLAASEHSFEVIKILGAHGIPRDLYQGGKADLF